MRKKKRQPHLEEEPQEKSGSENNWPEDMVCDRMKKY